MIDIYLLKTVSPKQNFSNILFHLKFALSLPSNSILVFVFVFLLLIMCKYLQLHNSTDNAVVLKSVNLSSTGRYRCEVSAEAPSFQTVSDHGDMIVVGEYHFSIFFLFTFSVDTYSYILFICVRLSMYLYHIMKWIAFFLLVNKNLTDMRLTCYYSCVRYICKQIYYVITT